MKKQNDLMEKQDLISRHRENKQIVRKFIQSHYEVGVALREIRDSRSYKKVEGYKTFSKFCEDEFDMNRRKADRLIIIASVTDNLRHMGLRTPPSGRICQELNQLDSESMTRLWIDVCGKNCCDAFLNCRICACDLTQIERFKDTALYPHLIYFSRILRTLRDYELYKEYGSETWKSFIADSKYCLSSDKVDQILKWYEEFDSFKGNLFDSW